jgi:hypothetical protein
MICAPKYATSRSPTPLIKKQGSSVTTTDRRSQPTKYRHRLKIHSYTTDHVFPTLTDYRLATFNRMRAQIYYEREFLTVDLGSLVVRALKCFLEIRFTMDDNTSRWNDSSTSLRSGVTRPFSSTYEETSCSDPSKHIWPVCCKTGASVFCAAEVIDIDFMLWDPKANVSTSCDAPWWLHWALSRQRQEHLSRGHPWAQ